MVRKYTRKVRRNKRHTRRRGGNWFTSKFVRRDPPKLQNQQGSKMTTLRREMYKHAQPLDINDIDNLKRVVRIRVGILIELFDACKAKCSNRLCSINTKTCEQAESMAKTKPASEFTAFCRIFDEEECQNFRKVFNSLTKIVYDINTKISGLEDGTTKNYYETVKGYIEENINKIEKPLQNALNDSLNQNPQMPVQRSPNSRRGSTALDPVLVNNTNGKGLPGNTNPQ